MIKLHNEHVYLFYAFMCWLAEKNGMPLAQITYYTLAQKERDRNWKPDHLKNMSHE